MGGARCSVSPANTAAINTTRKVAEVKQTKKNIYPNVRMVMPARLCDTVLEPGTLITIFLLFFAHVQTTCCSGDRAAKRGDGVEPSQLARELREGICATNSSQIKEFYRERRETEGRNFSFPDPSKSLSDA